MWLFDVYKLHLCLKLRLHDRGDYRDLQPMRVKPIFHTYLKKYTFIYLSQMTGLDQKA